MSDELYRRSELFDTIQNGRPSQAPKAYSCRRYVDVLDRLGLALSTRSRFSTTESRFGRWTDIGSASGFPLQLKRFRYYSLVKLSSFVLSRAINTVQVGYQVVRMKETNHRIDYLLRKQHLPKLFNCHAV